MVTSQGLIAHGRGEAFDYLLGEKTAHSAKKAITTAAACLLTAKNPVISVNGNAATLVSHEISRLASIVPASVEVNLFHKTPGRQRRISELLTRHGVSHVLGVGQRTPTKIKGVSSRRGIVDPLGIGSADVVLVPLEDGDRAQALLKMGKTVIAVDLNPLSRTSLVATVTIVDNLVRALPALIGEVERLKDRSRTQLDKIISRFDNRENLRAAAKEMVQYLREWSGR